MIGTRPPIPPVPTRPVVSNVPTFQPPKLDGSLNILEIYDWHAKQNPNHRLFVYADPRGHVRTILWPEAFKAIHNAAGILLKRVHPSVAGRPPIVAILSMSDTITYFTTMMGILRAKFILFPISPRNSAPAVAYLISKVGVDHVLVGHDVSMQDLANSAVEILKEEYPSTRIPERSLVPLFEDIYRDLPGSELGKVPAPEGHEPEDVAMYLHSSGSTAYPKPVAWTHHRLIQLMLIPWFGERDLTDVVFSLHTMPMYHGMGVLQLCWTASIGLVVAAFEPRSPAVLPSPENLFGAAKSTSSDVIFCVPSFIEAWSRKPDYIEWLATRAGVLYGGGPLNKEAGDLMTSKGVSIFILYGSTEGGIMSPILPAKVGYDWDYFRFPELVKPHMVPHGNNASELVMVANEFCRPSVLNTKVNGIDSYATSDLMLPHPTKPGYWRVFGRTDDQIMHSTGEKTNPGPLENMLNQDPHVSAAVMFGRGYFQAGVVIEPKPQYRFDPSDEKKLSEFRNLVWPTVERMNKFAPQHSRLFKEMILVAKPSKPFTYTAKNTARRQAILDSYEPEIEQVYAAVEESTQSSIPPPPEWDFISTKEFVREIVKKVLSHDIGDDEDIFQHDGDSLQATWIRNTLLRALKDSAEIDTRQSTTNFVYDYPSIDQLSEYVSSLALKGSDPTVSVDDNDKIRVMRAMVAKYIKEVDQVPLTVSRDKQNGDNKVVVVTGTTGALGSHILASLIRDSSVKHVYAVNRKAEDQLHDRQIREFAKRGIEGLTLEKVTLVEADTAVEGFGIDSLLYNEMVESVTHVIHNAWRVHFNLGLATFDSHVKGLKNMINFSLAAGARIVYTSTLGALQNLNSPEPAKEAEIEPAISICNGYTESKWVSERLLKEASAKSGLRHLIVRVGQLCGGLNGNWNSKEWLPSIVHSAATFGILPDDARSASWIPIHTSGDVLVEFLNAPEATKIVHLAHPRAVTWSSIARNLLTELGEGVKLVPYDRWLEELARKENLVEPSGALRLLAFFQSLPQDLNREAFGLQTMDVTQAMAVSPTLANPQLRQIDGGDVKRWLKYWEQDGLLKTFD